MKLKGSTKKVILSTMLILSIIGVIISGYQTVEHYFLSESICDFSENFSCSAVTESRFGELPVDSGVAASLWGLVWFIGLTFLVYTSLKKKEKFKLQDFYTFLYLLGGILFVAYFLFIELIVLPAEYGELIICPFCTILHIDIIILLVLSFFLLKKPVLSYLKDTFIEKY